MSHSSTAPLHTPPPMKKKVIAAILAVIVAHVGVLWAVSQMKAPELPQIKKEPLKVKFVKIKEPPPPPKELPKPKEPPKPKQVKIVEKELPPPKKVEKVVEVKKAETKKVVEKTVKAEPAPVVSTTVTTTVTAKTTPKADPEPAPKAEKEAEPVQSSPKSVSIGGSGVQWSRSPKLSFKSSELTSSCRVVISIKANEKGSVTSASVKNSSCSPELTNKVSNSVRNAKFKPYKENGIAYPISAEQPFDLTPTTR